MAACRQTASNIIYALQHEILTPSTSGCPIESGGDTQIDALFDHSITQPDAAQLIVWVYDKISAIRVRDLTEHGIRKTPQNLLGL